MHSRGDGRRTVMVLAGEVDGWAARQLIEELARVAADPGLAEVVLDMAGVWFIDSAGLRAPARARSEVREALPDLSHEDRAIVVLLTSEVVTNAVIHTEGAPEDTIGLQITLAPPRV